LDQASIQSLFHYCYSLAQSSVEFAAFLVLSSVHYLSSFCQTSLNGLQPHSHHRSRSQITCRRWFRASCWFWRWSSTLVESPTACTIRRGATKNLGSRKRCLSPFLFTYLVPHVRFRLFWVAVTRLLSARPSC